MTNRPPSVAPLTDSPLQQYYFRALICFAAAGTLASYMEWSELSALSPLYLGAMAFLLLYTYFTYHFTHKLPPERLKIVSRWLSYRRRADRDGSESDRFQPAAAGLVSHHDSV